MEFFTEANTLSPAVNKTDFMNIKLCDYLLLLLGSRFVLSHSWKTMETTLLIIPSNYMCKTINALVRRCSIFQLISSWGHFPT